MKDVRYKYNEEDMKEETGHKISKILNSGLVVEDAIAQRLAKSRRIAVQLHTEKMLSNSKNHNLINNIIKYIGGSLIALASGAIIFNYTHNYSVTDKVEQMYEQIKAGGVNKNIPTFENTEETKNTQL